MGVSRYRHHHHAVAAFLLLASASVATLSQLDGGFWEREGIKRRIGSVVLDQLLSQKQHSIPGSQPPSCRSKCGNCSPCKPYLVPIHPDLLLLLEYYPEVWRCKCGDKIFLP